MSWREEVFSRDMQGFVVEVLDMLLVQLFGFGVRFGDGHELQKTGSVRIRFNPTFSDEGFVIAGSPSTVRDMLTDAVKDLRIGNLMTVCSCTATIRVSPYSAASVVSRLALSFSGHQ